MSRATHKFEKRTAWKGTALLLPLIFIIGCNAVNKQPLIPGEPGRWVDSDGHGITWAFPPSDRVGHLVKYTDGPYKGKVYLAYRDNQHRTYIQRDDEKAYVYLTGAYVVTSEDWMASDGYWTGVWIDSDRHGITWVSPPSGRVGHFIKYTDGPYKGKVYLVHRDRDSQHRTYIQRDGEKVYVYLTGGYVILSVAWMASDGYWIGWAYPPPGMSGDERYVEYGEGPYIGKVYQVHKDEQGEGYIQRDGEKVYIRR